jgi:uncharacterized protein (TIGR03067 family)
MKRRGFFTLAVLVTAAIPASAQDKESVKGAMGKLQGKWEWVSRRVDGKEHEPEEFKNLSTVIKGEKATFMLKDQERITSSLKIDPVKNPGHMDITHKDGPAKGKTFKGIYKIDGDTFTMCFSGPDKDRPTDFDCKPGSGTILVVHKRVDQDEKVAVKRALEKLQGKWERVSFTIDGKEHEPEEDKGRFQVIKGEKATFMFKDQERNTSSLKIDPVKNPSHIDYTHEDGPAKGKTFKGIYKIDGDTFTVCFSAPDKDRPTDFDCKSGSGVFLAVHKRVK